MGVDRFLQAEADLWRSVGAAPTERWLTLASTGSRVRVLSVGDGPPVLFVHGATNAGSSWATLAARLPQYQCLLLDRPGCGLSEPSGRRFRDPADLARFADDLIAEVLDGLGLARASVVGTSYGGYFTLRAAAAHPDRMERLVLLSWSLGCPIERVAPAMRMAGARGLGKVMARIPPTRGATKALLRQIGLRNAIDSGGFDEVALTWFRSVLRDTATMRNELDAVPALVRPIRGIDARLLLSDDLLRQVAAPSLLLWGVDDPQGGVGTASAFAARIPGARLEMLDGAGHAPWMDDAAGVADRVASFLDG